MAVISFIRLLAHHSQRHHILRYYIMPTAHSASLTAGIRSVKSGHVDRYFEFCSIFYWRYWGKPRLNLRGCLSLGQVLTGSRIKTHVHFQLCRLAAGYGLVYTARIHMVQVSRRAHLHYQWNWAVLHIWCECSCQRDTLQCPWRCFLVPHF